MSTATALQLSNTCNNTDARSFLKDEWIESIMNSEFIKKCESGEITMEQLKRFLVQHQFYAKHFTRYLAAILSNIEDHNDRFELCQNLFDEMGLGDAGNIPHSVLYTQMMKKLNTEPGEIIFPETQNLIDTMMHCCRSTSVMTGLGAICLGAEGIVPSLYSAIVKGFQSKGVPASDLEFFTLHIACDDDHADTMFKIIDQMTNDPKNSIDDLNRGAEAMINARVAFLNSLI